MTEDALLELPGGWVWTTLGDIISVHSGKGLTTYQMDQSGIFPVYGGNGITGYHNKFMFEESKLILGRVGAKCGAVHKTSPKCWITDNALIVDSWLIDTNFLFHVLKNLNLNRFSVSTAQPVISSRKIYPISFGMPPLPEQRAIVAKIELLFSDLDNGIANLKKAQEQLKIYRQAVLKKAFVGELTRKWREEQTDLPSAEELLQQIKEEREKHFQKQLDEWKEAVKGWEDNGKDGKKPSRPMKPKELPPLSEGELKALPELPDGWVWSGLRSFAEFKNGINFNKNQKGDKGILTIDVLNMYSKCVFVNLDNLYWVNKPVKDDYVLKFGDILFVRSSVKREGVGWASAFKETSDSVTFCGFIIRARLQDTQISPVYVTYFLRTNFARVLIISRGSQVTITNISQDSLGGIPVPLAPVAEQNQIVSEIETRLSICDKLEATMAEALQKAEALRQSILKRAFEGKLLNEKELEEARNAPDWEPADKLLERIKTEKEKQGNKKSF